MNRQQFIDYLKSPELLNADSLVELENLVKDYPFFQSAATLMVMNLLLEKNIKYNDQLKLASAYASDRRTLKQLLNDFQKQGNPDLKIKKSVSETANIEIKEAEAKKEQTAIDTSFADLILQLKNEVNYYMLHTQEQNHDQRLEKLQILSEKLGKLIGQEEKPSVSPARKKEIRKTASTEYNLDHLEELPVKKKNQLANTELIDKFIKEEPKIVPKPTFFDPLDFARQSLLDNESVVSETLAEIYYKQGNLSKAIKIYKKLSLVNPQKSSYFAAQIEKIKREIK